MAAQQSVGITQWLCGGCGQVHGWSCPYFGYPGMKMSVEERAAAQKRMSADKAAGKPPVTKKQVRRSA